MSHSDAFLISMSVNFEHPSLDVSVHYLQRFTVYSAAMLNNRVKISEQLNQ